MNKGKDKKNQAQKAKRLEIVSPPAEGRGILILDTTPSFEDSVSANCGGRDWKLEVRDELIVECLLL